MAFGLDPLTLTNTIDTTDYTYAFSGRWSRYQQIASLVGVAQPAADAGPFVPYRNEELIEADQAVTLSLSLVRGESKATAYILCATSKAAAATNSVKTGGNFAATSLFGKKIKYGRPNAQGQIEEWDIVKASLVKNIRNHD